MKVLFITHYSNMYGANKSLVAMIEELIKLGVSPLVICPRKGPLTEVLNKKEIRYHTIPYKLWVSSNSQSPKKVLRKVFNTIAGIRIANIINKQNIQIVHSNSSATQVGAFASRLSRVKHVWHFREFLKEDYNLEFDYGFNRSIDLINKNADMVIAISKKVYEKYSMYINKDKITTVYNGISSDYIVTRKVRSIKSSFEILLVGLLTQQKGQREAILAINELIKSGIRNVKLNIVGDGECRNELEALVSELELDSFVKFWGYQKEVNYFYGNNDIALMCSSSEAFGRITIEAMLAGIPVIGANAGATSELIVDNYSGLLYAAGNYKDLAEKINILISNESLMTTMGINAKKEALENYTAERNAKDIHSIYKTLLVN